MDSGIFLAILSLVLSWHFTHTNAQLRVLNGETIAIEQAPHTVAIFENNNYKCVGTLVKMDKVVTSAQCFPGVYMGDLIVRAGIHDLTLVNTQIGQKSNVYDVDYGPYSSTRRDIDIAVVTLKSPFSETEAVKSIPLCPKCASFGDSPMKVCGWGSIQRNVETPCNLLHTSELQIMDKDKCKSVLKTHRPNTEDTVMCAGATGKNPYHGDVGAGGVVKGQLCAVYIRFVNPFYPGIFTDVTHPEVHDFLTYYIGSN